jgi:cytochrome c biogenesis protein CcmG/thiol:disulfide interchange protein DsbE
MNLLSRRAMMLAPSGVLVAAGSVLLAMRGNHPPRQIVTLGGNTSALIGKPLPEFTLPALGLSATPLGVSSADVHAFPKPLLLNFFASWCAPCREEIPSLQEIARRGVALWGVAVADKPADSAAFLHRSDAPYQRVGSDQDGNVGRLFGLLGVPESFLIVRGVVRWSWAGGLHPETITQELRPLLAQI